MRKYILLILLLTTLADICLTHQAIRMQNGVVDEVESNLLVKKLIKNFGVETTLIVVVPIYLVLCCVFIFYFWIPKFKYLYISLAVVKSLVVVLWLIYFILYTQQAASISAA